MGTFRIKLEPWLAAAELGGEPIIARWARRLTALGHTADDQATTELDGHQLAISDAALAERLAGLRVAAPRVENVAELWALELLENEQRIAALARSGVRIVGRGPALISPTVVVEAGATLWPGVVLLGATHIAAGASIGTGAELRDVTVASGVVVRAYTVAERATIAQDAQVGPFAHLRAGSDLGTGVRVGNFVETKNARLHAGAKAGHLSYLGDCAVGERVNIGAGTITCNYDGGNKHRTEIDAGAFIGSNTSLVAPVHIGADALVGAGSTITADVPDGALAIARGRQRNLDNAGSDRLHRVRKTHA